MNAREIAKLIAADLFTNGAGRQADRLVLTSNDGRDLGGWGYGPVVDRIERALVINGVAPLGPPERAPTSC